MTATLHRLRTRRERLRVEQHAQLRQQVLALDLPDRAREELLATLDRHAPSRSGWTFVMLSPEQNAAVVHWLRQNSAQPMTAMVLWSECFRHQGRTGEILATRDELAAAVGTTAREVSRIMTELESIGAIIRRREPMPGRRGPGRAVYQMNPNVSTQLTGRVRDRAQSKAPTLTLIPNPKKRRRPHQRIAVVPTT